MSTLPYSVNADWSAVPSHGTVQQQQLIIIIIWHHHHRQRYCWTINDM